MERASAVQWHDAELLPPRPSSSHAALEKSSVTSFDINVQHSFSTGSSRQKKQSSSNAVSKNRPRAQSARERSAIAAPSQSHVEAMRALMEESMRRELSKTLQASASEFEGHQLHSRESLERGQKSVSKNQLRQQNEPMSEVPKHEEEGNSSEDESPDEEGGEKVWGGGASQKSLRTSDDFTNRTSTEEYNGRQQWGTNPLVSSDIDIPARSNAVRAAHDLMMEGARGMHVRQRALQYISSLELALKDAKSKAAIAVEKTRRAGADEQSAMEEMRAISEEIDSLREAKHTGGQSNRLQHLAKRHAQLVRTAETYKEAKLACRAQALYFEKQVAAIEAEQAKLKDWTILIKEKQASSISARRSAAEEHTEQERAVLARRNERKIRIAANEEALAQSALLETQRKMQSAFQERTKARRRLQMLNATIHREKAKRDVQEEKESEQRIEAILTFKRSLDQVRASFKRSAEVHASKRRDEEDELLARREAMLASGKNPYAELRRKKHTRRAQRIQKMQQKGQKQRIALIHARLQQEQTKWKVEQAAVAEERRFLEKHRKELGPIAHHERVREYIRRRTSDGREIVDPTSRMHHFFGSNVTTVKDWKFGLGRASDRVVDMIAARYPDASYDERLVGTKAVRELNGTHGVHSTMATHRDTLIKREEHSVDDRPLSAAHSATGGEGVGEQLASAPTATLAPSAVAETSKNVKTGSAVALAREVYGLQHLQHEETMVQTDYSPLWETGVARHTSSSLSLSRGEEEQGRSVSKLESVARSIALRRQRANLTAPQVVQGKEFQGPAFLSEPRTIEFKDFQLGKTYSCTVKLTNVSLTFNSFKVLPMEDRVCDFFEVAYTPAGRISAGISTSLSIRFTPQVNRDLRTSVPLLAETGPISIPIVCSTRKLAIDFPDGQVLDFGTICVGDAIAASLRVRSLGALSAQVSATLAPLPSGEVLNCKNSPHNDRIGIPVLQEESTTEQAGAIEDRIDGGAEHSGTDLEEIQSSLSLTICSPETQLCGYATSSLAINGKAQRTGSFQCAIRLRIAAEETEEEKPRDLFVRVCGIVKDVPVSCTRDSTDLKCCMYDRLYRTHVELFNRGKTAFRCEPVIPKGLKPHVTILPDVAFVQPGEPYRFQLKFRPRISLATDAPAFCSTSTLDSCQTESHESRDQHTEAATEEKGTEEYQPEVVGSGARGTPASDTNRKMKTPVAEDSRPSDEISAPSPSNNTSTRDEIHNVCENSDLAAGTEPDAEAAAVAATSARAEVLTLRAPITFRVTGQTLPVVVQLSAQVTEGTLTLSDTRVDFGTVLVNEAQGRELTVRNESALTQSVGLIGLPECLAAHPNDGFVELLPRESHTFHLVFTPSAPVDYRTAVTVASLRGNRSKVRCVGTGASPQLELSDRRILFPAVALGDQRTESVTIQSLSDTTLRVCLDVELEKTPGVFSVAPRELVLAPQSTGRFEITAAPPPVDTESDTDGASAPRVPDRMCRAAIAARADPVREPRAFDEEKQAHQSDTTVHRYWVQAECASVAPELVLSDGSVSGSVAFGHVPVGEEAVRTVALRNCGRADSPISTSPLDALGSVRILAAPPCIAAGDTADIVIAFSPKAQFSYQQLLRISGDHNSVSLRLHGDGVSPNLLLSVDGENFAHSPTIDMGDVAPGDRIEMEIYVKNQSEFPVEFRFARRECGAPNFGSAEDFALSPSRATLRANAVGKLRLAFSPDHESQHFFARWDLAVANLQHAVALAVSGRCWERGAFCWIPRQLPTTFHMSEPLWSTDPEIHTTQARDFRIDFPHNHVHGNEFVKQEAVLHVGSLASIGGTRGEPAELTLSPLGDTAKANGFDVSALTVTAAPGTTRTVKFSFAPCAFEALGTWVSAELRAVLKGGTPDRAKTQREFAVRLRAYIPSAKSVRKQQEA